MAIKYVDNFEFPAEAGFTGSKNVVSVRGHSRKTPNLHDRQMEQGKRMGFKEGGQVQMPKPDGNALTQRGKNVASNQRDLEFGDQGPLKPGFKKGGKIKDYNLSDKDAVNRKMQSKIDKGATYGPPTRNVKQPKDGGKVSPTVKPDEAKGTANPKRKGFAEGGLSVIEAARRKRDTLKDLLATSNTAMGGTKKVAAPVKKRVGGPVAANKGGRASNIGIKTPPPSAPRNPGVQRGFGAHKRGGKVHSSKPMFGK